MYFKRVIGWFNHSSCPSWQSVVRGNLDSSTARAYRCTLNTVFVFYLSSPAFCYFILLLNDRGIVTFQLRTNRLKSCVLPLSLVKRQSYFWLVTPYQKTLSRLRGLSCSQFHQRHICPLNSHLRIEAQRRKNLIFFNRKVLKIHLNYE